MFQRISKHSMKLDLSFSISTDTPYTVLCTYAGTFKNTVLQLAVLSSQQLLYYYQKS